MEGFRDSIVDERVRSPPGGRDAYGVRRGSVFGLAHNLEQLALLRPGRRHPRTLLGVADRTRSAFRIYRSQHATVAPCKQITS